LYLAPVLLLIVQPVAAQDLEDLLTQVGQSYAEAYTEPLINAFGANQNTGLYHTAQIPGSGLTFTIALKASGTYLAEEDQTFRRVLRDVDLSDYLDPGDPGYGEVGDVVFEGPTVFGDTERVGTATAYVNGVPVYQVDTIPGLVDTRWVPFLTPHFEVGGVVGLKASLRWLPSINIDNYGKTKYLGLGINWSPNFLLDPTFPVQLMVGYFTQELDLGTTVQTEANSLYAAASRQFGLADVYAGLHWEKSEMTVDYTEEETGVRVNYTDEGVMTSRFNVGATFNLGVKLNAEMGIGKMVVYSVGIMFAN
jgi:hypothetical protein